MREMGKKKTATWSRKKTEAWVARTCTERHIDQAWRLIFSMPVPAHQAIERLAVDPACVSGMLKLGALLAGMATTDKQLGSIDDLVALVHGTAKKKVRVPLGRRIDALFEPRAKKKVRRRKK
jgi:hypothetical protein